MKRMEIACPVAFMMALTSCVFLMRGAPGFFEVTVHDDAEDKQYRSLLSYLVNIQ